VTEGTAFDDLGDAENNWAFIAADRVDCAVNPQVSALSALACVDRC
jgi:hypothetical protein